MNAQSTFAIISILFLVIIICDQFILYKLKGKMNGLNKSIRNLESKLSDSEMKRNSLLKEIELLKWQIANPPKYKKGDKIGELIINSYEVYNPGLLDFIIKGAKTFFGIMFGMEKEIPKNHDEIFKRQYVYHLTHTISGEKVYKRELELIELSKPKE